MKVIAIRKAQTTEEQRLVQAQHRLRARIFAERLHWDVTVRCGLEADRFDLLDPTYILTLVDDNEVAGCARLLPATGPTMLVDVFPALLPPEGFVPQATMVESSRFCVDTSLADLQRKGVVADLTLHMFAGIIEWCLAHGFAQIVTVTDLGLERILARVGWPLQRIGSPAQIGVSKSVAGILPVSESIFAKLRPNSYQSDMSRVAGFA